MGSMGGESQRDTQCVVIAAIGIFLWFQVVIPM